MKRDLFFAIDHVVTCWTVVSPSHDSSRKVIRDGWPALANALDRLVEDSKGES